MTNITTIESKQEYINLVTPKQKIINTIQTVINCLENNDDITDHYDCIDDLRTSIAWIEEEL